MIYMIELERIVEYKNIKDAEKRNQYVHPDDVYNSFDEALTAMEQQLINDRPFFEDERKNAIHMLKCIDNGLKYVEQQRQRNN